MNPPPGAQEAYSPDRSLKGKLRRRLARLQARRPAGRGPGGPMISFSFDDAPVSACSEGAAILEAAGMAGTYYISAGLAGRESPMGRYAQGEAITALSRRGHEIGCHTFSHLDCGQASAEAMEAERIRNGQALADWGVPAPQTFAYPYGDVRTAAKRVFGSAFAGLRALHPGLVGQGSDLAQMPAVGVEGPGAEDRALAWIDRAARHGGWLILYTHDVRPDPSPWGCTPQALARLVQAASARGVEAVTVAEGVRRLA